MEITVRKATEARSIIIYLSLGITSGIVTNQLNVFGQPVSRLGLMLYCIASSVTVIKLLFFSNGNARRSIIVVLCWFPFFQASFMHAYWNSFKGSALSDFITYNVTIAVTLAVYEHMRVLRREQVVHCAYAFMTGVSVILVIPWIGYIVGVMPRAYVFFQPGDRYNGFMYHMNQIGIMSTTAIVFWSCVTIRLRYKIALAGLPLISLLLCGSKFNLAITALALFIVLTRKITIVPVPVKLSVWVCATILVIQDYSEIIDNGIYILSVINPSSAARLLAFAADPENSQTFVERQMLWSNALTYGEDVFPFGVGPDGVEWYLRGIVHAHNSVLNMFLVYGIGGLWFIVVYVCIAIVYVTKRTVYQDKLQYAIGMAGLFAFLGTCMSDSFSSSISASILTLLGFGVGERGASDEQNSRRSYGMARAAE